MSLGVAAALAGLLILLAPASSGCAPGRSALRADTHRLEAGATHPEQVAGADLPWPDRTITLVRPVEVGPWRLARVRDFGLGAGEPDRDAAGTIAKLVGIDASDIALEGSGSVVVRMPEGEPGPTARLAGKPDAALEVLTLTPGGAGGRPTLQRTAFALYDPRPAQGVPGREENATLVVLLPGMFGTPEPVIDSLVGRLRGRGHSVLRMLTHPSRFTERAEIALDPLADPGPAAAQAAALFGDRAAECALAVEAACTHLAHVRHGTPVGRRLALGMSGGGMVLPTVVAREPDAYAGAVLIGAACDYAAVAIDSNYTEWIDAVRLAWAEPPTDAQRDRFTEAYRAAAPLDSYHTASHMPEVPVLMIHGENDRAVPAPLGDLLWERLGRPERWSVAAGHEVLFLAYLPTRLDDLLDWIDTALKTE